MIMDKNPLQKIKTLLLEQTSLPQQKLLEIDSKIAPNDAIRTLLVDSDNQNYEYTRFKTGNLFNCEA